MEIENLEEQLKVIEDKLKDAVENLGDVEVRDAILEKAQLYEKYGNTEKAIETYQEAYKKTIGIGKKMDVQFMIMSIYIKEKNLVKILETINACKKLLEDGGDWERKNRLKIFEGLYSLLVRNLKKTSELFLECISTFNAPDIISYARIVKYTILTSLISVGRSEIKKKVIHNPEVLSTIRELPELKSLLDSYAKCDYKGFFVALTKVLEELKTDEYLQAHRKYFTREIRVVIYSQFLEAYKTVTLVSMSQAFGVSVNFIDSELSELISAGRITCKIDKVQGIVESERMDERNNLYKQALKQGDLLLNHVQKLSRVIDV